METFHIGRSGKGKMEMNKAEKLSTKLIRIVKNGYWPAGTILHWCPACKEIHTYAVDEPFRNGARWSFDGNKDKPTFAPSMNYTVGPNEEGHTYRCHYFLKAGMIEYLNDCTHAMKGKTVELPDIPDIDTLVKRYTSTPEQAE